MPRLLLLALIAGAIGLICFALVRDMVGLGISIPLYLIVIVVSGISILKRNKA